jgi:hypothetical protein
MNESYKKYKKKKKETNLVKNLKGRNLLEYLSIDRIMILIWILNN